MFTVNSTPQSGHPSATGPSPRARRIISTPNKQKPEMLEADPRDGEIERLSSDVHSLKELLHKARMEREAMVGTISHLEQQLKMQDNTISELRDQNDVNLASFRRNLENSRLSLEAKCDKTNGILRSREELLLLWTEYATAAIIEEPTASIRPLLVKTCESVPAAREKTNSIYQHYVSTITSLATEKVANSVGSGKGKGKSKEKEKEKGKGKRKNKDKEAEAPNSPSVESPRTDPGTVDSGGHDFNAANRALLNLEAILGDARTLGMPDRPEVNDGRKKVRIDESAMKKTKPKNKADGNYDPHTADNIGERALSRGMTAVIDAISSKIEGASGRILDVLDLTNMPADDVDSAGDRNGEEDEDSVVLGEPSLVDGEQKAKKTKKGKGKKKKKTASVASSSGVESVKSGGLGDSISSAPVGKLKSSLKSSANNSLRSQQPSNSENEGGNNNSSGLWWQNSQSMDSAANRSLGMSGVGGLGGSGKMVTFSDEEISNLLSDLRMQQQGGGNSPRNNENSGYGSSFSTPYQYGGSSVEQQFSQAQGHSLANRNMVHLSIAEENKR